MRPRISIRGAVRPSVLGHALFFRITDFEWKCYRNDRITIVVKIRKITCPLTIDYNFKNNIQNLKKETFVPPFRRTLVPTNLFLAQRRDKDTANNAERVVVPQEYGVVVRARRDSTNSVRNERNQHSEKATASRHKQATEAEMV